MRNYGVAAIVLGGLSLMPIASAMAQSTNVAYAVEPRPDYVVFLDNGSGRLSADAADVVRIAADAAKSAPVVKLIGRGDRVAAVKRELVRDGVPAASIVAAGAPTRVLPRASDGIADPLSRRVEIEF